METANQGGHEGGRDHSRYDPKSQGVEKTN